MALTVHTNETWPNESHIQEVLRGPIHGQLHIIAWEVCAVQPVSRAKVARMHVAGVCTRVSVSRSACVIAARGQCQMLFSLLGDSFPSSRVWSPHQWWDDKCVPRTVAFSGVLRDWAQVLFLVWQAFLLAVLPLWAHECTFLKVDYWLEAALLSRLGWVREMN